MVKYGTIGIVFPQFIQWCSHFATSQKAEFWSRMSLHELFCRGNVIELYYIGLDRHFALWKAWYGAELMDPHSAACVRPSVCYIPKSWILVQNEPPWFFLSRKCYWTLFYLPGQIFYIMEAWYSCEHMCCQSYLWSYYSGCCCARIHESVSSNMIGAVQYWCLARHIPPRKPFPT